MSERPSTDNAATSRFTRAVVWLFGQVRPAFHTVLLVFYVGLCVLIGTTLIVVVKRCFGEPARIDFLLLGSLFGPVAMGALLSSFVPGPTWLRTSACGAISGLIFALLIGMKFGPPPMDVSQLVIVTVAAAAAFPLIRWLALKGY